VLPNVTARAGRYFTFDGSGNASVSAVAEVSGSLVAMERTGNGSTTVWTLPVTLTGGSRSLIVSVDGVVQPISSYTVSGDQLTFSEAPPSGAVVDVRVIGQAVSDDDVFLTAAAASADLTITVTGAVVGASVHLGLPASPAAGIIFQGFVSATNTVTIRATNISAGAVDPASASYRATVLAV
jgi:hypothetical protein